MEIYVLPLFKDKCFIGIHYKPNRLKSPGKDYYLPDNELINRYPPIGINEVCDFSLERLISIVETYNKRYGYENVFLDNYQNINIK